MCILLYVKLILCSGVPEIYCHLKGGISAWGICAFCYIWNLFCVVVFHWSMVNWWGEGTSALGLCTSFDMWNLLVFFDVVVFNICMVNWRREVKLHFIMTQRFGVVMFHRSMVNWRRGEYICPRYICTTLYVKLILGSGVPEI